MEKCTDDIAVIGLACRFPGAASDAAKLWSLLSDRKSAFTNVPSERFNVDSYYHPSPNKLNTLNSRGAHFMQQNVAAFDAPFFGITAQEANAMDPAARMLLEVAFEAFENAGQRIEDVAGSDTSCYVGCFTRDYHEMLYRDIESVPMYTGTGTGFSLLSNRISWFYDLRGPSMTLDTACSSSLVGLHLACRGLQAKESKMAIVCGANVILSPDIALTLSNLHMLSMDGLSRSFAEGTTGYGRGEGIAGLVLKRVDDAIRDGDPIRAVIRGSGVNQDGHTKGITLPNSDAQADLINRVYTTANLDPVATGYFEAHGTGTAVGDPLELGAIAKSISRTRDSSNKLFVGSIKSNIGHLEGAAGLAGVIKCVLMVEKNAILPNIHFHTPNRRIPFDQWKIKVPTELSPWPDPGLRRASVNSFGYGGTNAHVIIDDHESYLKPQRSIVKFAHLNGKINNVTSKHHLIVLSAKDEGALKRLRHSYHEYITEVIRSTSEEVLHNETEFLDKFAYTLGCRRSNFPTKSFIVATSLKDLSHQLVDKTYTIRKPASSQRIGFVFTGQGAQWAQMGVDLMVYPVFEQSICEADKYLSSYLGCKWSASGELKKRSNDTQIELAEYSQPLSTILQVALVDLLKSWHVTPAAVVGHSSGEIAAAYALGAISKTDAWKVSYLRGQLCSQLPSKAPHLRGSMMAVGLGPEAVVGYLEAVTKGKVVVACVNSPSSVTLSGDETGIDEILESLKAQNVFARKLRVQNAYHSHHMQLLADEYETALQGLTLQECQSNGAPIMSSSVTGKLITPAELGPRYWVRNLVSPVQFSDAVETLLKQAKKGRRQTRATEPAIDLLLEVGPHAALKGPLRQIFQAHSASDIPYTSVLQRGQNGVATLLSAAGEMLCHGVPVDFMAVNGIHKQPDVLTDLPTYPWNHTLTYWADSRISRARQNRTSGRHDLLGAPTQDSDWLEPRWRHFLRTADNPWIRDHVVHNSILYPGSGILGMPIHALIQLADPDRPVDSLQLKDVRITKAIVVPDDQFGLEVFLRMRQQRRQTGEWTGWWEFSVCSNQENDHIQEHAHGLGTLHYQSEGKSAATSSKSLFGRDFEDSLKKAHATVVKEIKPNAFYNATKSVGLAYGPTFQGLTRITAGKDVCSWEIQVPDTKSIMPSKAESPHLVHPTTLDIIFHSLFAAIGDGELDLQHAAVPIEVGSLTIAMDLSTGPETLLKGFSRVAKDAERDLVADIYAAQIQATQPSIIIEGLRCRELPGNDTKSSSEFSEKAPIGQVIQKADIDMLDAVPLEGYLRDHLAPDKRCLSSAIAIVYDLVAHKNPDASFLQIGGLSAEQTESILEILDADAAGNGRFKGIKFIDSNRVMMDELSARYQNLSPAVDFVHHDGDEAPIAVDDGSVDLVILDSRNSPPDSWEPNLLQGVRFAKPSAKLLVIGAAQHVDVQSMNSLISLSSPLDLAFHDDAKITLQLGALKTKTKNIPNHSTISVVLSNSPTPHDVKLAEAFLKRATVSGQPVNGIISIADVSQLDEGQSIVSLLEYSQSFLEDLSEADFTALKRAVLSSKHLLWISKGDAPIMSAASGFLRSLQNENTGSSFCHLKLQDKDDLCAEETANLIVKILSAENVESEYNEENGVLCCSRWAPNHALSALVGANQAQSIEETISLSDAPSGLILQDQKSSAGLRRVFVGSQSTPQSLLDNEVEIEITSLLLSDPTDKSDPWREALGVVSSKGKLSTISVGAKVSLTYRGHISTIVRTLEQYVQPLPENMDPEASNTPIWSILFPTVHHSVCTLAQLDASKSAFVQGGGSLLGQVAVSLAIELGADAYASVQTEEESLILQNLGLGVDHILDARDVLQRSTIMHLTGGRELDFVLNTHGSEEEISQLWSCMAPRGTFVDVSAAESNSGLNLSMKPFRSGARFEAVNLWNWVDDDLPCYLAARSAAMRFLDDRPSFAIPKPLPFTTDALQQAFDALETNSKPASAVLQLQQDIALPVLAEVKNTLRLRPDATYILAGGLGGLGRGLARLMVDSGARHLVFLSRSGPGSAAAQTILEEFTPRGVKVAIHSCNVASAENVKEVFSNIDQDSSLPPVRGIIQSAAVLRDSIFENMSHLQWTEATRPKIQGTWNLHQASLCKPCATEGLDFFVMLASISGFVGNRGQANYACGNSYQDALAKYRRSLGLAATSVDLGLMQDIGLIAEQGGQSNLKDDTVVPLTARDFELIFKLVLNSERRDVPAQIITGLPTGGILQRRGITSSPFYYRDERFAQMRVIGADASQADEESGQDNPASIEEQLAKVGSAGAASVILEAVRTHVAKTLRCPPEDVDVTKPLHAYGMDSLMAVDMRAWIETKLKAKISLFEIMGGGSIQLLADKIVKASEMVK